MGLFEVYLQGILALHGCDILGFMDTHTINFLSLSNRICGHLAKDTLNFHWIFFFPILTACKCFSDKYLLSLWIYSCGSITCDRLGQVLTYCKYVCVMVLQPYTEDPLKCKYCSTHRMIQVIINDHMKRRGKWISRQFLSWLLRKIWWMLKYGKVEKVLRKWDSPPRHEQ